MTNAKIPEEEMPGWIAALAAVAVVVFYAWWTAWKRKPQIGA